MREQSTQDVQYGFILGRRKQSWFFCDKFVAMSLNRYLQASNLLQCENKSNTHSMYDLWRYYKQMDLLPVDCPKIPENFHLKLRNRYLKKLNEVEGQAEGFINSVSLFKGIETIHKNYDDNDYLPQQESTFWYFFGVKQPDCLALIHNTSGKTVLFIPQIPEDMKLWMIVKSKQQFQLQYGVDEVLYTNQIKQYLSDHNTKIYLFSGLDSDSGLNVDQPSASDLQGLVVNRDVLWPLISNLRAIKTADQIQLLRYVCKVTSQAEMISARSAKVGLKQIQLHSVFHYQHSVKSGSIQLGFNSICSSGRDCATLHYIDNDKLIVENQMVLLDMGGRWYGYVADQAMTFPVSGKFTQKQREVYTAVYQAQQAVKAAVKPGVLWQDMHILAQEIILKHLIQMGIVKDTPIKELVQKRVGAVFFPHGLGHLFGLKVHDIGGYTEGPARSELAGLNKLRTRRTLQEGICITVEPGLYFIDFMIKRALQNPELAPYLNAYKIEQYREVGGVRLEDDIVITKDGYELLSSLPRSIEDIQNLLKRP